MFKRDYSEINKNGINCKDCKYCKRFWPFTILSLGIMSPYEFAKCTNKGMTYTYKYCSTHRCYKSLNMYDKNIIDCGSEGLSWR